MKKKKTKKKRNQTNTTTETLATPTNTRTHTYTTRRDDVYRHTEERNVGLRSGGGGKIKARETFVDLGSGDGVRGVDRCRSFPSSRKKKETEKQRETRKTMVRRRWKAGMSGRRGGAKEKLSARHSPKLRRPRREGEGLQRAHRVRFYITSRENTSVLPANAALKCGCDKSARFSSFSSTRF